MAHIIVNAIAHSPGGPAYPRELSVYVEPGELAGEFCVHQLTLAIGSGDSLTITMVSRDEVRRLAERLAALAANDAQWVRVRK